MGGRGAAIKMQFLLCHDLCLLVCLTFLEPLFPELYHEGKALTLLL